MTAAEIEAAVAALPAAERSDLLDQLRGAYADAPPLTGAETEEVRRRSVAVRRGDVTLTDHAEVMRRLDARIADARRREEGLADAA